VFTHLQTRFQLQSLRTCYTLVKTLRQEYGDDFAKGYPSDTKLETVREDAAKSQSELVKKK
jgi:ribonuclease HII